MSIRPFPIEKVFGSRTRVKIISLFTTGISRPYYVREISRTINERLNAVRRELGILQKIGMLGSYNNKRRKYYTLNQEFILFKELASIMKKVGPQVDDGLFKNIERIGNVQYACASGIFTGAKESPTDLLVIGNIDEKKLEKFAKQIESRLDREIIYTPITENEYRYRRNFNDIFLNQVFSNPHKVIINKLRESSQSTTARKKRTPIVNIA